MRLLFPPRSHACDLHTNDYQRSFSAQRETHLHCTAPVHTHTLRRSIAVSLYAIMFRRQRVAMEAPHTLTEGLPPGHPPRPADATLNDNGNFFVLFFPLFPFILSLHRYLYRSIFCTRKKGKLSWCCHATRCVRVRHVFLSAYITSKYQPCGSSSRNWRCRELFASSQTVSFSVGPCLGAALSLRERLLSITISFAAV